jgi:hypothetical protein
MPREVKDREKEKLEKRLLEVRFIDNYMTMYNNIILLWSGYGE